MKKLRVMVVLHEDLIPPAEAKDADITSADWRTEFDVMAALNKLGHEVRPVGLRSDMGIIRSAIEEWRPHVAFNLLEEFDGSALYDQNVVSFLELLRVPYTGCNPRGLMLARDKALCKTILHYHRIATPDFVVFQIGRRIRRPARLNFPLIVKSLLEEASLGISQASVVYDDQSLEERVKFIHERIGTDALVEQYIDGRELYVSILGNSRLEVFPIWELFFRKMPENSEKIATARAKWDKRYQKRRGIESGEARNLSEETSKRIIEMCKRIYKILGMNGCARIDLRMTTDGAVYFIEANPNPQLAMGEDFADAAKKTGVAYCELMQRLLNLGMRWAENRSG